MNNKGKLNAISLFSGYGGIDLALSEYVTPIIYCDIEKYAQGILLSRMDDESLSFAPIWNDVTTLDGTQFRGLVDIIYGGFPCQDLSVAGKGKGLEGERSGLFREIIRLAKEASPTFIFLENVPAIRTRGSIQVQEALASIGYDTRWLTLSAAEVGANHKRERWFCLATNTKSSNDWKHNSPKNIGQIQQPRKRTKQTDVSDSNSELLRNESGRGESEWENQAITGNNGTEEFVANTLCEGLERQWKSERVQSEQSPANSIGIEGNIPYTNNTGCGTSEELHGAEWEATLQQREHSLNQSCNKDWWSVEPDVGRVANGVAFRVDRIKALGNGVVPLQVKTAFEILSGVTQ